MSGPEMPGEKHVELCLDVGQSSWNLALFSVDMYLPGECYSYSQFPDIRLHESRAVSFETEGRAITSNEEVN